MARRIVFPQMWKPRTDAVREAYQWFGDLEDLPELWRTDRRLEVMPNGDLRVLTVHHYARAHIRDFIARNLAGGLYPIPEAEWLAGYQLVTQDPT
jgi:hypothetical protein